MRGEWIEILPPAYSTPHGVLSLPMRGEWIEIYRGGERVLTALSLPMRGEWIEIISPGQR